MNFENLSEDVISHILFFVSYGNKGKNFVYSSLVCKKFNLYLHKHHCDEKRINNKKFGNIISKWMEDVKKFFDDNGFLYNEKNVDIFLLIFEVCVRSLDFKKKHKY
uniref:Uncharacterized protein n=1 Tax=viral metagenome TaxID=1070528 RepID=A0A6C0LSE1_9ZZZZ